MKLNTFFDSIYVVHFRKVNETEKSTKGMEQERGGNIKTAFDLKDKTSVVVWKIEEEGGIGSK